MIPILVIMNVIAAVLPVVGLIRLAVKARRELERSIPDPSAGRIAVTRGDGSHAIFSTQDLARAALGARDAPLSSWRSVRIDLGLVGTGILLGAVANIWSLFLAS